MTRAATTKIRGKGPVPKKQQPARSPGQEKWILWLCAILLVTYFIYQPSLDNAFTNWDDNYYVTENVTVTHPTLHGLLTVPVAGNYHPLTMASLALNYAVSGPRPATYHWLNLLLHLANTALVFLLIRKLSGGRLWTTAVTALFFGIHPMHVESVAWIAERKDVLYALFYLIALITYLRYLDTRRLAWLAVTWFAFVLSVASKPAAVVLPLTLFAIDYFRRRPFRLGAVAEKVPFLLVSLAAGVLTVLAQKSAGAVAAPHQWTLFQKVLFASYGTVMYVVKLLVPLRLSAIYPYPTVEGAPLGLEYYVAFAALVIVLPTIVYLCRHNRVVLFGLAFFFINIVLVLQFFSVGQAVMADRYTYLPYIGLFFALAWWLDERPSPKVSGVSVRANLAAMFLVLAPLSLVQTWMRCDVWQNAGTLWNDTIEKYPGKIIDAYNNRAYYYIEETRYEEALADLDQAIAMNPKVPRVWVNKGNVLAEMNYNDSAYVCFARALELKPDYPEALSNRGGIRSRQGDLAGAVEDFTRAIAQNPNFRDAYGNRALVYFKMGEFEKAVADRRRVVDLDPKNPNNYVQLGSIGLALQQLNRPREAIAAYDDAIRVAPEEDRQRLAGYHLRRSQAWWALRDRARALTDAREAARLGAAVDSVYLRELGG
jgi:tetratricopeptide (TPR) repeat protein